MALLLVLQFPQSSDGRLQSAYRRGAAGPGTSSYCFHAGTIILYYYCKIYALMQIFMKIFIEAKVLLQMQIHITCFCMCFSITVHWPSFYGLGHRDRGSPHGAS